MPHSYEEIRSVALDILVGREKVSYGLNQYQHLSIGIAEVLARREGRKESGQFRGQFFKK